ncbi:hypothetical protein AB0M02_37475 [Actinoplanes sp. NPDC051861]|uniref:hypothetical protein n=1 Tax=Actinoplanes sp. NPDC051861 TaxID=3155170 RepID=UPI003433EFF0
MIPARSVAASVVALGFASTLTAPIPAFANPAPCQRFEHYAAQAGAQILRINRLETGPLGVPGNRKADPGAAPGRKADPGAAPGRKTDPGAALGQKADPGAALGRKTDPGAALGRKGVGKAGAPGAEDGERPGEGRRGDDANGKNDEGGDGPGTAENGGFEKRGLTESTTRAISGVGIGDSRSVLIADGPVHSAAAARVLDGRVPGSSATNDLVVQQTPPTNAEPTVRRAGERRFGPLKSGGGKLTAHARWDDEVRCGTVEATTAAAELGRITLGGVGNGALVRVPEKILGLSNTGLRQHEGELESVASATVTAGRISLADNQVRIRVLRAPALRVTMNAAGTGKVDYRPAVLEVTGPGGQSKRLETVRDHVDITISDGGHVAESLPSLIEPIGPLPVPRIGDLPSPGEPETTPAPDGTHGTKLRISLGDVRQAAKDRAIAARADAVKVALVRERKGRDKSGYAPSSVVADLGVGILEGAAVAPKPASGVSNAGAGAGSAGGGVSSGTAGLPITGPRALSVVLGGVALLIGGIGVVLLSRKRRVDA